jgi:hypothetical protein
MFYNQGIFTIDVQDNQLVNEGKTADHPIEFDCNNGGSSSLSNDGDSLFSHDNPQNDDDSTQANTQNDDDQDDDRHIEQNMMTGLDQDKVDSSTSDDEASRYPSEDGSKEAGGNSAQA